MSINIGKMQHRVEIQRDASLEQDAHGNPVPNWMTEATVWAYIKPLNGNESQPQDQVKASATHEVRIRYRRLMNPGKRLKYGTRLFDVNSVVDVEEQGREMLLGCTELVSVSA